MSKIILFYNNGREIRQEIIPPATVTETAIESGLLESDGKTLKRTFYTGYKEEGEEDYVFKRWVVPNGFPPVTGTFSKKLLSQALNKINETYDDSYPLVFLETKEFKGSPTVFITGGNGTLNLTRFFPMAYNDPVEYYDNEGGISTFYLKELLSLVKETEEPILKITEDESLPGIEVKSAISEDGLNRARFILAKPRARRGLYFAGDCVLTDGSQMQLSVVELTPERFVGCGLKKCGVFDLTGEEFSIPQTVYLLRDGIEILKSNCTIANKTDIKIYPMKNQLMFVGDNFILKMKQVDLKGERFNINQIGLETMKATNRSLMLNRDITLKALKPHVDAGKSPLSGCIEVSPTYCQFFSKPSEEKEEVKTTLEIKGEESYTIKYKPHDLFQSLLGFEGEETVELRSSSETTALYIKGNNYNSWLATLEEGV